MGWTRSGILTNSRFFPESSFPGPVKESPAKDNQGSRPEGAPSSSAGPSPGTLDLKGIYDQWAGFVWLSLQRLGVRSADLDDICHDVFLIVHRKLPEYDARASIKSWLFGVCVRVAANYRRRARFRFERGSLGLVEESTLSAPESSQPEHAAVRRQTMLQLEAALERIGPVKRAVLVMFEVEGMSCDEIGQQLGLPVGTVYSRLHTARKSLLAELERAANPNAGDAR